jgi:phage recombination protein Bet
MSEKTNQVAIQADEKWSHNYPQMAQRGIDESFWGALTGSIFPGASEQSILMAVDYCRARKLDVLMKPVHLVPMSVKDDQTGKFVFRDVVMPGVGLYRIQAERTGNYAGADSPKFGDMIDGNFTDKNGNPMSVRYPEWCEITVYKLLKTGERVAYSTCEYWEENYATQKSGVDAPNSMWQKRPRGQLAKCAEAQALRRGWPEIGQDATFEEMEGKTYVDQPHQQVEKAVQGEIVPQEYPQASFDEKFPAWEKQIKDGDKKPEQIIKFLSKKVNLSAEQIEKINQAGE